MTIEEAAGWAEKHKLNVCHNFTVDDLNHLHRGGRVSKTVAIIGTLVQIKPILRMDNNGALEMVGQVRGRKKSIHKLVEKAAVQAGIPVYASAVVYTAEGIRDVLRKDNLKGKAN